MADAQPLTIANWIPPLTGPTGSLGDGWTFKCPKGGTFSASADSIDDDGQGNATADLRLRVFDGEGTQVADGDDDMACSFTPVCPSVSCPAVTDVPCGDKGPHLLLVFEASNAGGCHGGGYELTVEVKDKKGKVLAPKKINLGGGAKRKLPKWHDPEKARKEGPAINDEEIMIFGP